MRVLAGGPARETASAMFELHVEGLRAQGKGGPEKADCGGSPSSAPAIDVTVHHELVPDCGGPRWHVEKIENVARARQAMMGEARGASTCTVCGHDARYPTHGYDARCFHPDCKESGGAWLPHDIPGARTFDGLFLVDTDVIIGPGVLERLWAVDADVVHAVYWTPDDWGQPKESDVAPQVWWTNPYDWNDIGAAACWNALCEPGVNEVEVNGGGACTLIRGRGFESHYWPLLESLRGAGRMWPGEDRTFCLGLECRGIRQVAVTGLPVVHLYTDRHRTPVVLARAREMVRLL